MELLNIDPMVAVLLTGLVAGIVEAIKRAFKQDWTTVAVILGAGVVGGLGGWILGIDVITGIVAGFATSGYITIVQGVSSTTKIDNSTTNNVVADSNQLAEIMGDTDKKS